MGKSKYFGIIIGVLLMALTIFLLLMIPNEYNGSIWATLVFDCLAFVFQFILFLLKSSGAKETFYKYPAMTMSTVYLTIQFVVSLVIAIMNQTIPFKIVLIINFVILVVMWVLILSVLMTKEKIESLDSRQKDHHTE